jgi:hypothetical protein
MFVSRMIGAMLAALISTAASAQFSLVGTYRLISAKQTVVATGEVTSLGHDPYGFIMYGADGRVMVLLGDAHRSAPPPGGLDNATKARLFDTMGGYGGTYSLDGTKVIHHIDIATRPVLVGTDAVRYVEKRGNRLILTTKAAPSPRDGVVVTFEDVWEKLPDGGAPRPAP